MGKQSVVHLQYAFYIDVEEFIEMPGKYFEAIVFAFHGHKVFPQLANSSKHACDFPGSQEYVGVFSKPLMIYHSSGFSPKHIDYFVT